MFFLLSILPLAPSTLGLSECWLYSECTGLHSPIACSSYSAKTNLLPMLFFPKKVFPLPAPKWRDKTSTSLVHRVIFITVLLLSLKNLFFASTVLSLFSSVASFDLQDILLTFLLTSTSGSLFFSTVFFAMVL